MNKEQYYEITEDAYKNYAAKTSMDVDGQFTKEEFINKIKTDPEFSVKWGLKIEEQEILEQVDQNNPVLKGSTALCKRKLITVTYNNKTITSYD
jgi:hypothetical protein